MTPATEFDYTQLARLAEMTLESLSVVRVAREPLAGWRDIGQRFATVGWRPRPITGVVVLDWNEASDSWVNRAMSIECWELLVRAVAANRAVQLVHASDLAEEIGALCLGERSLASNRDVELDDLEVAAISDRIWDGASRLDLPQSRCELAARTLSILSPYASHIPSLLARVVLAACYWIPLDIARETRSEVVTAVAEAAGVPASDASLSREALLLPQAAP